MNIGISIQWDIMQPLKRNEILTHAAIWMNLEKNILSKIRQTPKDKYGMIPIIGGTWNNQIHRNKEENSGFQRLRGSKGRKLLFNG